MKLRPGTSFSPRLIAFGAVHVVLVVSSYVLAVLLRFEFSFPARDAATILSALPVLLACRMIFFARYHLFRGWWQYVGIRDILDILKSTTAGSLAFIFLAVVTGAFPGFPRSLWVLEWLLTLQLMAGSRVLSRLLHSLRLRLRIPDRKAVLLIGSGPIAESTLRELIENPTGRRPIGFLDDGSSPERDRLRGLPLLGSLRDLPRVLEEQSVSEIFIAIPTEHDEQIREVMRDARAAGIPFRILPSVREHLDQPRRWDLTHLEDLFEMDTPQVAPEVCEGLFRDRVVLIIGACGRIGSALALELARARPRHLLLLDRNESPLYYLEIDLRKRSHDVHVTPIIGDILDADRLRQVMRSFRPDIVIQAAGYTRIDLQRDNREEFRQNNLGGTANVLRVCDELSIPRLLLLSCDESHNDAIACLHRTAERLLLEGGRREGRIRAAIRFPSILGSPGCAVTEAAIALQEHRPIELRNAQEIVRVSSCAAMIPLLLEAFSLARDGEVLAIDFGRAIGLLEAIRYVQQVWNLKGVPTQPSPARVAHSHPVEPGTPAGHRNVLRRTLAPSPVECPESSSTGQLTSSEPAREKLLEDSSGR